MRALVVRALLPDYAGCSVEDIAEPSPGPGQVKVKVKAVSVNFPDLLMTRGEYQMKPPLPFTPGLDIAGEVAALGPTLSGGQASGLQIGDAVVGGARLGGFAQYAVLDALALSPKPDRLSFAQAAAYPAAYLSPPTLPWCGGRTCNRANGCWSTALREALVSPPSISPRSLAPK
jgi:NADPH2:quinone reductase